MTLFYGRRAQVTVQAQKQGVPPVGIMGGFADQAAAFAPGSGVLVGDVVAGMVFDGLHIAFKAEKDNLGHPNTLDLSIFNLSAQTRRQLQSEGAFVQLLAGYVSDLPTLPLVFAGNARTIDHLRRGADWITRIQCGDGETAYRFGAASASFPAGTPSAAVAGYLAQQIKAADPLRIDISAFMAKALSLKYPLSQFVWGFATSGNAFEELQRLLGGKYELSIQNGELRALQVAEGTKNVVLLSPATGMLGSPEHGTPNANGLPSLLKVTSLLQPGIQPGDIVALKASDLAGNFRVQKIVHTGDLAGNDWQSEMEMVSLGLGLTAPV